LAIPETYYLVWNITFVVYFPTPFAMTGGVDLFEVIDYLIVIIAWFILLDIFTH
jgi:hypothetical protein